MNRFTFVMKRPHVRAGADRRQSRGRPGRRGAWPGRAAGRVVAALLAVAAVSPAPAPAAAATGADWQLRHHDAATDTSVYQRDRADGLPAFRAVTRMHTRLSALVAVVQDSAHMPEWVYRTRLAETLERDGPTQGVSRVVTAMPWPLWDREAIVAWQLTQDAQTDSVTLAGHSDPVALPAPPDQVRMPSFESRWHFEPVGGGDVEVTFEGHADLGGNLALPLLRMFVAAAVWQAPLETINGLRRMVRKPAYRDAVLPYIREPGP
jgi:hypothetical protein